MKSLFLGPLISAAFIFTCCKKIAGQKSGPYDVLVKRLDDCEDQGTNQINFGTRINSKGNNVYSYTNNITLAVPWDHLTKVDVEVQQLSGGIYRPRFITTSFKNCQKFMKVGKDLLKVLLQAANVTTSGCPIPVGIYSVHDWVINIKFNNMPSLFYNSYKMIVNYTREKIKVGCIIVYGDVVPKEP